MNLEVSRQTVVKVASRRRGLSVCLVLLSALPLLVGAGLARAEIYIYLGPNGDRVMTDRPLDRPGYHLQHRLQDVRDAGHIMAGREDILNDRHRQFYDAYIQSASHKFNIDPALVKAVIRVESDFNPLAVSSKGAQGLMQLMPATAARYRERDLLSPIANINVGVQHLAYLLERYSDDLTLALAAYNAGEESVDHYQGIPPFRETQGYVKKVLRYQDRYRSQGSSGKESTTVL